MKLSSATALNSRKFLGFSSWFINPLPTGQVRVEVIKEFFYEVTEVIDMVDLSTKTIKKLFERQIRELTLGPKEDSFDYQFSGGWLRWISTKELPTWLEHMKLLLSKLLSTNSNAKPLCPKWGFPHLLPHFFISVEQ